MLSRGFPISTTGLETGCFGISDFALASDFELGIWVLSSPSQSLRTHIPMFAGVISRPGFRLFSCPHVTKSV